MSDEKKTVGKRQAASSAERKCKNAATIAGVLLIVLILLGALGFGGYTAYNVLMGSKIFPGVRMGDCDLSGMDRAQARAALESAYGGSGIDAAIDIQAGDQLFTLSARECGLEYDIPASIDQAYAYGRQGGFIYRARQYWSTRNNPQQMELVTVLDRNVLQTRVDEIAAAIEQPMAPSSWSYADGVITMDKGQTGYSLDKEHLYAALDNKLHTADFAAMEAVRGVQDALGGAGAAVPVAAVRCDLVPEGDQRVDGLLGDTGLIAEVGGGVIRDTGLVDSFLHIHAEHDGIQDDLEHGHDDGGAFLIHFLGDALAEALSRAGHDGDLAAQTTFTGGTLMDIFLGNCLPLCHVYAHIFLSFFIFGS